MATVTHEAITPDTGATPNTSDAFVPVLNDLLVVFVVASDTVQITATLTSSVGMTFTRIVRRAYSTANSLYAFVSDTLVSNTASQTVEFDTPADAATGTVIAVCAVAGVTRTGLSAILQISNSSSGAGGTTPAATFPANCLTGNPTLGLVGNLSNPAAMTPPTDWTERGDVGYNTPATGGEYVTRDNGFTGTVITWGGTSATSWGALGLEIDTSAAPGRISKLAGLGGGLVGPSRGLAA